ncbi:MAG: GH92 family glycosyl hydrolase [Chitinophagales bacterium]|nr:GH92 family glycosyl hydrolase [Chitinophagales bacterium]
MNRAYIGLSFILLVFFSCAQKENIPLVSSPFTSYVNPFIGTDGKGNTYPGAAIPFGMIQLSPDNGRNGWDWISGYFYPDTIIAGFSHLHLSGTGAGDLYDISFLPVSGKLKKAKLDDINKQETVYSRFSHDKEKASPGYYQVFLDDYDVNVELTVTERTGLQKYTFEKGNAGVRLHLGYTRNWDSITESYAKVVNDSTIIGCRHSVGWARDQKVYFAAVFSTPFSYQLSNDGEKIEGDSINGKDILLALSFSEKEVMVKTGISSVSTKNAMLNLTSEQHGFDFELVRQNAQDRWENALQRIKVQASPDNLTQFYTAMYHSMLAPTLFSDVNGEYKGTDGKIWQSEKHARYSTYSLWDTYRALHPWLTIAAPEKVEGLLYSMLQFYDENKLLPVWNMQGSETNMMMGYHAVPVLADAILKGFPVDVEKAYEAMKASAMQDEFGIKEYKELGYVPFENGGWNVSKTLEYAFDDWCIAQIAKHLGKEEDYKYFLQRAANYRNHFDAETGFFRAKSADNNWKDNFDPLAYHPEDYCEANAWQYYWYVPQNIEDLIQLTGGADSFEKKLDEMFKLQQSSEENPEWISGYIGQYVHGNEPSHHVPYLYQYIGAGQKTQQRVRQIMDELYTTQANGLAGNEDCGQMSAWYLYSALGFYPVNPADGKYILGSPEVDAASIQLANGKSFQIKANNQSAENIYVKAVSLNGKKLDDFFIMHEQIMAGGELIFEMSKEH